ncbi:MAG TPA: DUF998 domain-containing protein [Mycobacteriales bacterium]|nr:DUF998 domain-containing protein [Mycobacteriales bacterium]
MDGAAGITTGAATIAAVGAGISALVVLHRLPTGLSPVRDAVSHYGITPYRLGYRIQTLAYAAAGATAAVGIGIAAPGKPTATVACCAVFAASRALISWFPMDQPGTPHTTTGRRHGLLALAAFAAAMLAAFHLGRQLDRAHVCHVIAATSIDLGWLMVATLVGMVTVARVGWFGLVERLFYLGMTAWLVVAGVLLLR